MFGGSRYNATVIAKDHPNTEIYVNGNKLGEGTVTGSFPRKKSLTVELKQEGCQSNIQTFDNTFRTGNFILSALTVVGIAVDLGTGASFKPDHGHNLPVTRMSSKNYIFSLTYPGCSSRK